MNWTENHRTARPALGDGQWVTRAGVNTWVPAPTPPPPIKRAPAKCGTDGGYYRHLRTTKTEPCEGCKEAHAAYERDRYARAKDAAGMSIRNHTQEVTS